MITSIRSIYYIFQHFRISYKSTIYLFIRIFRVKTTLAPSVTYIQATLYYVHSIYAYYFPPIMYTLYTCAIKWFFFVHKRMDFITIFTGAPIHTWYASIVAYNLSHKAQEYFHCYAMHTRYIVT